MKWLKKLLYYGTLSFLFCFTIVLAILLNFGFSTPKTDLQPLPNNLVSLKSEIGNNLLAESNFRADYSNLKHNFESQSRRAFCGVASSVIALNSLGNSQPAVTQTSIFNSKTRQVVHPLKVTFGGMTLTQLNNILQVNQLNTKLFFASDIDINRFRSIVRENSNNPHDIILVNYQRSALGQIGSGHISPIAAYHQQSDRILIFDVAAYRYPPVWVRTQDLWNGINSIDRVSNRSRGFVVAQK